MVSIWGHASNAKLMVCVSSSLGLVVTRVRLLAVVKVVLGVAQDVLERRQVDMEDSWYAFGAKSKTASARQ